MSRKAAAAKAIRLGNGEEAARRRVAEGVSVGSGR